MAGNEGNCKYIPEVRSVFLKFHYIRKEISNSLNLSIIRGISSLMTSITYSMVLIHLQDHSDLVIVLMPKK